MRLSEVNSLKKHAVSYVLPWVYYLNSDTWLVDFTLFLTWQLPSVYLIDLFLILTRVIGRDFASKRAVNYLLPRGPFVNS